MNHALDFSYLANFLRFLAPMGCQSIGPDGLLGASYPLACMVHHAGGLEHQLLYDGANASRARASRPRPVASCWVIRNSRLHC